MNKISDLIEYASVDIISGFTYDSNYCRIKLEPNYWTAEKGSKYHEAYTIENEEDKIVFTMSREEAEEFVEAFKILFDIMDTPIIKKEVKNER